MKKTPTLFTGHLDGTITPETAMYFETLEVQSDIIFSGNLFFGGKSITNWKKTFYEIVNEEASAETYNQWRCLYGAHLKFDNDEIRDQLQACNHFGEFRHSLAPCIQKVFWDETQDNIFDIQAFLRSLKLRGHKSILINKGNVDGGLMRFFSTTIIQREPSLDDRIKKCADTYAQEISFYEYRNFGLLCLPFHATIKLLHDYTGFTKLEKKFKEFKKKHLPIICLMSGSPLNYGKNEENECHSAAVKKIYAAQGFAYIDQLIFSRSHAKTPRHFNIKGLPIYHLRNNEVLRLDWEDDSFALLQEKCLNGEKISI